jgi:RNA polymerase sigma-70 factor (ECF subfamily)
MVQASDVSLRGALERLFREQNVQLFISALAVTGCPERAEDAVQEAFYRLFRLQCRPRRLKAYVFRCVRNAAVDQLHRSRPAVEIDDDFIFDCGEGPEQTAERNEFRKRVVVALRELSGDERETIISHLFGGLTFREIAIVRETSVNTAWSWYRRGMKRLRRILEVE